MECSFKTRNGVSCSQCIGCSESKIKHRGLSICYDEKGMRNCGYYGLCSQKGKNILWCKLYIPKK